MGEGLNLRNPDRVVLSLMTRGADETRALGVLMAEGLAPGDFIALDGELGAGKTCLVQGLAQGLAYRGPVASPTFALLHLYEGGRLPLYHFDVYRLKSPEELEGLGYEDYFYGDGVCVVEWGGRIPAYLPARRAGLLLERPESPESPAPGRKAGSFDHPELRRITLTLYGDYENLRRIFDDRAAVFAAGSD